MILKASEIFRFARFTIILILAISFNLYADGEVFIGESVSSLYPEMMAESSQHEWIEQVQMGTLDNRSGNDNGYGDYSMKKFNAAAGSSININLIPGFSSGCDNESWKVWIDYNQDNDFADPGEEVFAQAGYGGISGSFVVPLTAALGETRVRVAMRYNVEPPANGIGFFDYGEVEDYTIIIEDGGSSNVIFKDLSVEQAYALVNQNYNNPNFIILDVRTPPEFSGGHLENAVNMDYYSSEFIIRLNGLDKTKAYLVYCRSGYRSGQTMELMKLLGFTEVYNMLGGILAWSDAGYPVVTY